MKKSIKKFKTKQDKKEDSSSPKKNDRIAFLEKEFVGKDIQEGSKTKYDFSKKDKNGKVLPNSFLKVSKNDFNEILKADPTFNKQYTQWLLNIYVKGNLSLEDLYKATEDLSNLYKFKNKIEKEKRDITQFENLDELYAAVQKLSQMSEDELLSQTQIAKKIKLEGAEVHLDSERWRVLTPLNHEAARIYGAGTRWCTATSGWNQFESYTKTRYPNSKLYIIIDKKASPGETVKHKYQWHFESKSYMDALDHQMDWRQLLNDNEELKKCFLGLQDGNGLRLKFLFGVDLKPEDKIIKNGNLSWLREYAGDELPEGLVIHGDLDLSDCRAKKVKNLTVYGKLIIRNSKITHIEGKLHVEGLLDAEKSLLESLPDGAYIQDSVMLKDSKITKFPKNFKVGGHLFASYIQLSEKPSDIEVKHNLYMHGSGYTLEQIPSSVKVHGKIFTSLLNVR